jgi:putative ABC transport system permease protein
VNEPQGQYEYQIEGIPLNSSLIGNYPILPANITSGRTLQAGDSGVVVLSEDNARQWGVSTGGTVNILGQGFKIVGIHGTSGISDVATIYMSLSDAQTITNNTGNATTLKVFVNNANNVGTVSSIISNAYSGLIVSNSQSLLSELSGLQSSSNKQLQEAQNTMSQTQSTAMAEIIVAVVAGGAIVLILMLYTVRERTKEIGTLKALGASNMTILGQFMLEGLLLSLMAGVVGIAIGLVGATTLSTMLLPQVTSPFVGNGAAASTAISVTITPELLLIGLGAAILLGTLGSLYPAWRGARTKPSEAMRYE